MVNKGGSKGYLGKQETRDPRQHCMDLVSIVRWVLRLCSGYTGKLKFVLEGSSDCVLQTPI